MKVVLLAGTSKGLVEFHIDKTSQEISKIHFKGLPVSMVYVDVRRNTWWVGLSHQHWGEKLHCSIDRGKSWHEAALPSFYGYDYRPGKPATLKKLWVMQHAGVDRPNALWLGTEPGGLFYSEDNGKSFHLNESLWNDPSRQDDSKWFGTGKDYPFIHSILVDPRNSNHVYLGISCAGVYETIDGGNSWSPKNNGLIASYLPKATPEVGHDPHQMLLCPSNPDVLWQQNHCGIFRTINGGQTWVNVSDKTGEPSYGFALAIDPVNPEVAWVIPAESDESRIPKNLKLEVYKTIDGGENWVSCSVGLPYQNAFDLVLRHGFINHENILAFGTTNGNLYTSLNGGNAWSTVSQNLAPVNSLAISV
jgi:hypothetical protein